MRIACPPLVYGCPFINFTSSKSDMELITRRIIEKFEGDANKNLEKYATTGSPEYQRMVDEIASQLGLTSLKFNTIEQLVEAIGLPKCQVCTHCFDGSSAYTLNDLKNKLEEKNKIAESIHIEYSQIAQKSQFAEESVKRILREIDRLKDGISDLEDSKEESQTEIAVRSSQIEEITDTIKTAAAEIESYSSELTDLKSRKEEGQATLKGFFTTREECQNNLVTLEKEQFRLSQNKEKLENNRDSKIEYMWNEYELTLSEATQLKDDELSDASEIKKIVTDTKNEIRKLGDVNVNAIEDYKEVAERYEFLKNQHDDLVSARDKLITVIEELDKNMREQFTTKFEEIKIEFDKVFRQLFGGGKGTGAVEKLLLYASTL